MASSVHLYVRFTLREKRVLECLRDLYGHRSISETIRFLVRLGLNHIDTLGKERCILSNGNVQ